MSFSKLKVNRSVDKSARGKFTLHAGNTSLLLGQKTYLMAVLNLTPDSFSGDGKIKAYGYNPQKNLNVCQQFIKDGADIIDVGGESSRPGAQAVSQKEEVKRVIPTIKLLAKKIKTPISIDTTKETVAKYALDAGVKIVNNIMGLHTSNNFLKMIKNYNAAIVLMHMRGNPKTMQKNIHYKNLIKEIITDLKKSIEKCLEIGIKSDKIIVDPGIGFGKTAVHNIEIIKRLGEFSVLKKPILIGTSRKSFIGKILNREVPERLPGTIATVCASIFHGAHILRAHDIKEVKDAITVTDLLLKS